MPRPGACKPRERIGTEDIRKTLVEGRERLRQRYYQSNDAAALLRNHSRLVDDVLRCVWRDTGMPDSVVLVAVGGYGRRELFPYSDVDLLVLVAEDNVLAGTTECNITPRLERWVRSLWDLGLDIGHSIRTVGECMEEAAGDITVQTSLLETRLLAGKRRLFNEFANAMQKALVPRKFFAGKQHEQRHRH